MRSLIHEMEHDIFILMETWMQGKAEAVVDEITPKTHEFYHKPRNRRGGGVGIFLSKKCVKVKTLEPFVITSFEYLLIKFEICNKKYAILIIYRPPSSPINKFLDEFAEKIDYINDLHVNDFVISGDFNFHFENDTDANVRNLKEILNISSLRSCVDSPTSNSLHTLDLVIIQENSNILSGLEVEPDCSISDHRLINFNFKIERKEKLKKTITFRRKTDFNADTFIEESSKEFFEILNLQCECGMISRSYQDCIDCLVAKFNSIFSTNYNLFCPLVNKTIVESDSSPWLNTKILSEIRQRRVLERRWRRLRTEQSRQEYCRKRNVITNQIRRAKTLYYNRVIEENRGFQKTIHKS